MPSPSRRSSALAHTGLIPEGRGLDLVSACLAEDRTEARAAYDAWRRTVAIEDVGVSEFRLLPLLYRRLLTHGIEDETTPRLKGIYRQALFRNHLLIHRAFGVIDLLEKLGVPCLAIKGLPLLEVYYGDRGARGMGDVDVVVPEERAQEVLDGIEAMGRWRHVDCAPREWKLFEVHCANFVDADGLGFDLHWHILYEACYPGADASFWKKAVPFQARGRFLRTLCPADTLFLCCIHGARSPSESLLRWIPDAVTVVRKGPEALDWHRIVRQARRFHQVVVVEGALRFLAERFDVPVPASILNELARSPVTTWDLYYLEAHAGAPQGGWQASLRYWSIFWMRLGRGRSVLAIMWTFPRWLRTQLGMPSSFLALAWVGWRLMRRIGLTLVGRR